MIHFILYKIENGRIRLCKLNNIDMVNHEPIYQFLWRCKKDGHDVHLCLRHGKPRRVKRGKRKGDRGQIADRRDMSERLAEVEK